MKKYMDYSQDEQETPEATDQQTEIMQAFIEFSKEFEPKDYIKAKKFDKTLIKSLGIGCCDQEVMSQMMQKFDKEKLKQLGFIKDGKFPFVNKAVIPFNDHYFSIKATTKTEKNHLFPTGIKKEPWHIKRGFDTCYVVEGESDAIALYHTFDNADILSLGGVLSQRPLKSLSNYKKVVFAFDNDESGRKGLQKALKIVKCQTIAKLKIPDEYKDVHEVFYNEGVEFLKQLPEIIVSEKELLIELKNVSEIVQQEIPKPGFKIEGLIPEGGVAYVAGSPGIGKSLIALYGSMCISAGRMFFNKKTIRGKVLYFDSENGILCAYDRIKQIAEAHDFSNEELNNFYYSIFPNIRFDTTHESYDLMVEILNEYKPDVLVFDSLVRFMIGSENDAEAAKMVFDFLRILLKTNPNLTIIILHHVTKNNAGGMNALRGSSELAAAASTILMLHRKQQGIKISLEKSRFVDLNKENNMYYRIDKDKGLFFEACVLEELPTDALGLAADDFWQWVEEQKIEVFSTQNLVNFLKTNSHSKNTAFSLIKTLADQGYITKLTRGKYEIKNRQFKTTEDVNDEQD